MVSYVWKKKKNCNIWTSLPSPNSKNLYLRQLKNNQNQMNTTWGQNLKEFNNTAGWLSGFLQWINQVESPSNHPSASLTDLTKKDNSSNLVIWTSTMSNIRIQKLLLLVTSFFLSHKKRNSKGWVCYNFPPQCHFLGVPSMKNIILNILKIWR